MAVHPASLQSANGQSVKLPLKIAIVSETKFFGESLAQSFSLDSRLSVRRAFQSWIEALSGVLREVFHV